MPDALQSGAKWADGLAERDVVSTPEKISMSSRSALTPARTTSRSRKKQKGELCGTLRTAGHGIRLAFSDWNTGFDRQGHEGRRIQLSTGTKRRNQFAHAGGIMIVTPEGKLSRYFYGIDYAPKDVSSASWNRAGNKVGNPAEQAAFYCYHYDPATGKYGLAILQCDAVRRASRRLLGWVRWFLFFGGGIKKKRSDDLGDRLPGCKAALID